MERPQRRHLPPRKPRPVHLRRRIFIIPNRPSFQIRQITLVLHRSMFPEIHKMLLSSCRRGRPPRDFVAARLRHAPLA